MDTSSAFTSPLRNQHSSVDCYYGKHARPDSNITDWSKPITRCLAGDYSDLAANNIVYNKRALTDDMWIELPAYAKQFAVCGVYQIDSSSDSCTDSLPVCAVRHKNIWLRIPIHVLDLSAGHKIYRVEFKHKSTLELMALYFNYIVQDDQPPKPYVYMK